jgi:hypothetical protein
VVERLVALESWRVSETKSSADMVKLVEVLDATALESKTATDRKIQQLTKDMAELRIKVDLSDVSLIRLPQDPRI